MAVVSISTDAEPLAGAAHPQSAVAWGAIWAGAVVAVATSMVLMLAAAGVGFVTGFPGLASRASLAAFTPEIGAGAIVIQVLSGALGGYVAGRLRTTWVNVHSDESHFRDTAHGLIAWAVASVGMTLLAALVLGPYADALAGPQAAAAALTPQQAERAANIAAQSSLFLSIGMLLSAFVSAVAARLGGMQHEAMHLKGRD